MFPSYWLKWYLVCSNFSFTSLSAVQIYVFHIFLAVYSSLHGFIWKQHNDQLPVGLLAQLVERCTGIAEVMGSNPVQAWMFFSGFIFTTAQVVCIIAKITFIHVFIRSSNIWLSYILNRLFITSRVYLEPTSWPAPSWLVSSFGRALHRYRRGHGFKFRAGLNVFFSLVFTTAQVVCITARITFIHVFICSSNIWLLYILSRLFITSRVYLEPTWWPAPSWPASSVGRALHGIAEVMGSNPVQAWIFLRPCFHYCLSSVHYCEVTFIHVFICSSNIWLSYILSHLFITSRVYLEPT